MMKMIMSERRRVWRVVRVRCGRVYRTFLPLRIPDSETQEHV